MPITKREYKLCRKKEAKAQKALFNAYKAKVMGICRRYSSCKEEAEDILQESFIKIFENIEFTDDYRYLSRWIYKTTVNTAINYYHQNKRHHGLIDYKQVQKFDEQDITALDNLSNNQLISLINELPDGYRLVFNLYVIEGYKHNEIAELLEISENTSKSQLSRAKCLLKKRLQGLGIKKFEKYG